MKDHRCLVTRYDPRDWQMDDGNIKLKAAGNPDWTGNEWFFELQKINGFETDCCVIFSAQESVDAQIDRLIQEGEIPNYILDWFNLNGYMDTGRDGKLHFHSSERFVAYNTGNGFGGNAAQDPWIAMRAYGIIPWKDWPFDASITPQTYFNKPPTTLYDKGKLFLSMMGGKDCFKFHWVSQTKDAVRSIMDSARQTAPLCLGVATTGGWNLVEPTPPPLGTPPNHMIANDKNVPDGEECLDHYVPFEKILTPNYPIPQVMQGVVAPIFFPPAPLPPPNVLTPTPNIPATISWLTALSAWLRNILASLTPEGRARLQGAARASNWAQFEEEYYKTHLKICPICHSVKNIQLHHYRPFHVFPELEEDLGNLTPVCQRCHLLIMHEGNFQSINPNGREDLITWQKKIQTRPMTSDDIKRSFNP